MSAYEHLMAGLGRGATVLIDGATGTELERLGAPMHDKAWCAMANATSPDIVREVHRRYIAAGARVITTNTFSTNRNMIGPAGLGDRVIELNEQAVAHARNARADMDAEATVAIAGSMSHQVPISYGSDGAVVRTFPSMEEASENFREMAECLANAGVDFIFLEMMSNPPYANAAIKAARDTGLPVWVGFTVAADETGDLRCYSNASLSAAQMFEAIALDGVDVAGVMHSNVNLTGTAIDALAKHWDGPLTAYPDSGFFRMPHWQFEDIISPSDLAQEMRGWHAQGVRVIGGCCGLGIDHIEALRREFEHDLV